MSDRIFYAVGNTAGRDHIREPTILRSEIPTVIGAMTDDEIDTRWPVDVSLSQIMACDWKVRKWRLSGTCDCSIHFVRVPSPSVDETWNGTASVEGDVDTVRVSDNLLATRERDLVSAVFDPIKYRALIGTIFGSPIGASDPPVSDWSTTSGFHGDFSGTNPYVGVGMLGSFVLWKPDTSEFSLPVGGFGPPIGTSGNVIPIDHTANLNQLGLTLSFFRTPVTVASSTFALKAPGVLHVTGIDNPFNVPIQMEWNLDFFDALGTVSGSGSADFTLEATEFWPYT